MRGSEVEETRVGGMYLNVISIEACKLIRKQMPLNRIENYFNVTFDAIFFHVVRATDETRRST